MNPEIDFEVTLNKNTSKTYHNEKKITHIDEIWSTPTSFEAVPPIELFPNKNTKHGKTNLAFSSSTRSIYPIDPNNQYSSASLHKKNTQHSTVQGLAESSHHSYPKVVPPKIRISKKDKKKSFIKTKILDHPKRFTCFKIFLGFFSILLLLSIGIIIFAAIKPCVFTKCHKKASMCINRFPFWAQCICDIGYAGNGKSYCIECGRTLVQSNLLRVVGGTESVKSSWPFAVYIIQNYQGKFIIKGSSYLISYSWSCGGTILNHRTILTAAHCIHDKNFEYEDTNGNTYTLTMQWNNWYGNLESTFEVYVGAHDLKNLNHTKKYRVKKVNKHENFDEYTLQNDVATLQLDENIDNIQFACLPYNETYNYPEVNRDSFIVGWGKISEKGDSSEIQKNSKIKIYSENECSTVETVIPKNWNSQICAGALDGSTDTCQGDSGGGLFVQEIMESNSSQYFISGIVSYGDGCARVGKPGIYSRTSYFLDWIRKCSDY